MAHLSYVEMTARAEKIIGEFMTVSNDSAGDFDGTRERAAARAVGAYFLWREMVFAGAVAADESFHVQERAYRDDVRLAACLVGGG